MILRLVGLALLMIVAIYSINNMNERIDQSTIKFSTVSVVRDSFKTAGVVRPNKVWSVKASSTGGVESVNTILGEKVNKGKVLFSLSNEELESEFQIQNIALETLKLEKAYNQSELNNILSNKGKLSNRNKLRLEVAEAKLKANKVLLEKGIISQLKLSELEAELVLLKFESEQSLKDLEEEYDLTMHTQNLIKLKLDLAQKKLVNLKNKINANSILAPESGFITELLVTEGEYAEKGRKLAVITNKESLNLTIFVPAENISHIEQNDKVQVISSLGNTEAIITQISPVVNNGVVEVSANIVDSPKWLRPELQVEINFSSKSENVLAVKRSNYVNINDESLVYVLDKASSSVFAKRVVFGNALKNGLVEIKSGLNENDVIIQSSKNKLNNNKYLLI